MDTNNDTKNPQEIDLSYIYKSSLSFLKSVEIFIYQSLRFVLKNIVKLCIVAVLGVVLGYFWDYSKKNIYKHQIILKTNFDSSAFLYKKIANIKNNYENEAIENITIRPIIDVLSFIEDRSKRIDVAKYLSANNIEISNHKGGNQTEFIYKYHSLVIYTRGKDADGQIVKQFLDGLNSEPHYIEIQKIQQQQSASIIEEFQKSVDYINAYIDSKTTLRSSTEKGVNVDIEGSIADLIIQKNQLLVHLNNYKKQQIEEEKIFFDISILPNVYVYIAPWYRKIVLLPVLFVFGYLFLLVAIERYKKHRLTEENK